MSKTIKPLVPKSILINDKVFAYYHFEGEILWLKVEIILFDDEQLTEDIYAGIISKAEDRPFNFLSYLNI